MDSAHTLIETALGRWTERLHQMDANYHHPNTFRFSLDSFIGTGREMPEMLTMASKNHPELRNAIAPSLIAVLEDSYLD